jgi:hypothetical protein
MPGLLPSLRSSRAVQDRRCGPSAKWRWKTHAGSRQTFGPFSSADCGTLRPGAGPQHCPQGPRCGLLICCILGICVLVHRKPGLTGKHGSSWLSSRVPKATASNGRRNKAQDIDTSNLVSLFYRHLFPYCRQHIVPLGPRLFLGVF